MVQVLMNLVLNAYQAMPDGGTLALAAALHADGVALAVRDTGRGMSVQTMAPIFEPLFSTRIHGIGLGLPIVKNLVALNNGRILVNSTEGEGTVFTLILPVATGNIDESLEIRA